MPTRGTVALMLALAVLGSAAGAARQPFRKWGRESPQNDAGTAIYGHSLVGPIFARGLWAAGRAAKWGGETPRPTGRGPRTGRWPASSGARQLVSSGRGGHRLSRSTRRNSIGVAGRPRPRCRYRTRYSRSIVKAKIVSSHTTNKLLAW